jgi:glycosyltransferase involved in cell wall biosynthesis
MHIGVNARCLTNRNIGPGYYTLHLFQQMVQQHPEQRFIFFTDRPLELDLPQNASVVIIGKPVKGYFTLRRWLDTKIKKALKEFSIDIFISLDGSASLSATTPQVIGVTDLKFLDNAKGINSLLLRRYQKKAFQIATSIITVSAAVKQDITKRFLVLSDKIHVVPKAASDIFKLIAWEQRENVKATYTEGKEYFLFSGGFNTGKNLLAALKGFSQFKKWQQSNMKLVIVGDTSNDPGGMKQKIDTFRFRNDVIILNKVDAGQLHLLMSSSYAFIYPSVAETYGMPVLEAMQSGTAVITSTTIQVQIDKEAVLFVDANDETDIGNQMIRLYKDEELRRKLVEEGLKESARFNWKDSAQVLWELIETAGGKLNKE